MLIIFQPPSPDHGPGCKLRTVSGGPLTCPKCQKRMKIIAFIEDEEVIKKILKHLELWKMKADLPLK